MKIRKPQGDVSSWIWKARTQAARRLTAGSPTEFGGDDFDWRRYHLEYARQLSEIEAINTLQLREGQWRFQDGSLELTHGLPLHPNHQWLYETIMRLQPQSILEVGCGGGDHLANLTMLLPEAVIRGVDRSEGQLDTLLRRNPDVSAKASVIDLTLPHPRDTAKAELVFSQAVIMHIQTGNGHSIALWNMFDLATKHVVLMENLERHQLIDDVKSLFWSGILPWESLTLYQPRRADAPRILVASADTVPDDFVPIWST